MMKTALLILALSLSAVAADTDKTVAEHAAATVARLHDAMLDPASFVLDGAFTTKPDKHGNVSYCYAYRAHNAFGGYAEGRAVEDAGNHGRLSVYHEDNGYGHFPGYDIGWVAPCKSKHIDRDITANVKALTGVSK